MRGSEEHRARRTLTVKVWGVGAVVQGPRGLWQESRDIPWPACKCLKEGARAQAPSSHRRGHSAPREVGPYLRVTL